MCSSPVDVPSSRSPPLAVSISAVSTWTILKIIASQTEIFQPLHVHVRWLRCTSAMQSLMESMTLSNSLNWNTGCLCSSARRWVNLNWSSLNCDPGEEDKQNGRNQSQELTLTTYLRQSEWWRDLALHPTSSGRFSLPLQQIESISMKHAYCRLRNFVAGASHEN